MLLMKRCGVSEKLYHHVPHQYNPRNVNAIHREEVKRAGFNQAVAVAMTKLMSAMLTFWIVGLFIAVWIIIQSTSLAWDKSPYPLLLTILNLPQISMMIALGVGQGVLGRKQELQADETYQTTQKTYHDSEQIARHLDSQDTALIELQKDIAALKEQLNSKLVRASAKPKGAV